MEQRVGHAGVSARIAEVRQAALFANRFGLRIPLDIIHHQQIEQSVAIVIHPSCSHSPQPSKLEVRARQTGAFCDVGKGSVSIIVIEGVAAHAGNEDVLKAVVIVIADGHADVETLASYASLFRHVSKSAIAIVAE